MSGEPETLTPPWAYYRRTGLSEMRPYVPGEDMGRISVSAPDMDMLNRALKHDADPGGYIARNPDNHQDQWYVAQAYFDANLEPVGVPVVARDEAAELRAAAQAFVDKYFQPGSKADRPDYSLMVTAADVYALREALRLAGGESEK